MKKKDFLMFAGINNLEAFMSLRLIVPTTNVQMLLQRTTVPSHYRSYEC
jgi:hypothetical protein